ncbi:DUF58 domain-containing protein [Arthrobacter sp. JZ12]|uniref:DUF58 domain-containing protein n=1 Tax=Arthrobacter sp. JZ12 TaxID=2654190 RepID=UPI002B4728BF|nr:DUF58 domain-containing protein [Arthrobacter sp. JZ12]WRH24401.1 DUF58 domain-containing protein [Arthrobacter sp. JZ12]
MALVERLPRILTARGWGLTAAGVVSLLLAQFLGRRDLLYLGILLVLLPLVSVLVLRLVKPRFTVHRTFAPQTMETGFTTTVTLSVASDGPLGGSVTMQEQLPQRFGEAPEFHFPARHPTPSGVSLYEYRLRSAARGVYDVGPVTAGFTDPFGLGVSRHTLGGTDRLVVTPAPIELPYSPLTGVRGTDGNSVTRRNANPSDDDVMTREYRHGDPMRRVHWAATARHNELMVRQEESVTTPEATLILDQRQASHGSGFLSAFGGDHDADAGVLSSPTFEWAVVAAVSISAHLLERSYALRFVDETGSPALRRSVSAPWPEDEEFVGMSGQHSIAQGLAALDLLPDPSKRSSGSRQAGSRQAGSRRVSGSGESGLSGSKAGSSRRIGNSGASHGVAFGDAMLDKLALLKHHGPLIALLGSITEQEARELGPAAEYGSQSFAILVSEHPRNLHGVMDILRNAGWHVVAVTPSASLATAWAHFDAPGTVTSSTAKTTLSGGVSAGPGASIGAPVGTSGQANPASTGARA